MKLLTTKHGINGELTIPADKSISHRSIMFGAISQGANNREQFLKSRGLLEHDCCIQTIGRHHHRKNEKIYIDGKGFSGLTAPATRLDAGNSGTTMRLVLGILAGSDFTSEIAGDASLNRRPMERVMKPLREMGAELQGIEHAQFPPLRVSGHALHGIEYQMPIASAQVKSAILLQRYKQKGQRKSSRKKNQGIIQKK